LCGGFVGNKEKDECSFFDIRPKEEGTLVDIGKVEFTENGTG
jgi:hypothetical protein